MSLIIKDTVSRIFLERVQSTPALIAFEYKVNSAWKKVSFSQFNDECRRVSFGLMGLGVKPGEKVALLSSTRYEWCLVDMAILGAAAVTVPIYPSVTAEDIVHILENSETVVAVFEDSSQFKKVEEYKKVHPGCLPNLRNIVLIETSSMGAATPARELSRMTLSLEALREIGRREEAKNPKKFEENLGAAKSEDLMTICYTSGTTGVPKGVLLTHDNMVSVLEDCVKALDGKVEPEEEVLLSFLPFSHILGKLESLVVYPFGWRQSFLESMESLPRGLLEVRPTLIFAVPRLFEKAFDRVQAEVNRRPPLMQKLFQEAVNSGEQYFDHVWNPKKAKRPNLELFLKYQLADRTIFKKIRDGFGGRLKFAVCGGAPLPSGIGRFFDFVGIRILEGYGLTETCGPITLNSVTAPKFGSVGKPLPEVSLRIADDGEILVRSRKLFKGYFKMPEETAEVMERNWFHTGDIGVIDDDGILKITDRKKDLIVTSAGKNVAPQKIENMARGYPLISQFVVHGDRRNYLTALVTLNRAQAIRFASENDILFSEYSELVKNAKISALVQKIIDEINSHLASFETIKKFIILADEFTVESGELTPSLKIRRKHIHQRHREKLDSMYKDSSS